MATEGWRQATQETVITAAVILASDVVFQHLDGRLNLVTDKAAVKRALSHWAASRPGQIFKSAMKKGGFGVPMGTDRSLTYEGDVLSLLKAHGLTSTGKLPVLQGVHGYHKAGHTYDIMLGNGERITVRMDLPQSSAICTYFQGMRFPACDKMMSIFAILIEWGEHGYNLLSHRVLNAGLVKQVLMGSAMAIGVVVGGAYLVRLIHPLDPTSNNSKAILPATDDEDHKAKLGADEDEGSESVDGQDRQNPTGDDSGVEKIEEIIVEEEVERGPTVTELKYMEALRCLVETSSALEVLKSEAEQQKELLAIKDRKLGKVELIQGLLDASEGTIRTLLSEASRVEKVLAGRDQEIMHLNMANATLDSTADEQEKIIITLTTRAEERTKVIKHLTTTLADEQTEKSRLNMDIAKLRSDNNLQDTTIRTLRCTQREQEQKMSDLRKKNSALEIGAKKSVKIIEELETTNEELGAEVISLIDTNQDLETQLEDDTVAFDNKLDQLDQLTTQNEGLLEQVKALESKNIRLQKTLDDAKENIKTLQDMNVALKEEVDEGKQECRGFLEKCDEDDAELKAKDNKMQQLKKALRDNAKLSMDKDRKISELSKACKEMKIEIDESDSSYHFLEEEVDELAEARDSAETKLKSTLFELDQANIDLNRVRDDLEKSQEENEVLRVVLKGYKLEAKSDDEEEREDKDDEDEADEGKGDRDEAHEEDESDGSDKEYEDALDEAHGEDEKEDGSDEENKDTHDSYGPDSGGNEAGQDKDNDHHAEGYENGDDDDGKADDQGDDAPDAGAGKILQGGDDNQAGEQSATPTTIQEAPQQPLGVDGLSDTIRFPSASPLQLGPANNGLLGIPPAVVDPPFPLVQQPQLPQLEPVEFASGSPAKEGRIILPIRRRKNASGRAGNQPAQTSSAVSNTDHPSHNQSAAEAKAPPQRAEEEAQQQPLRSDESIEPKRSSSVPSAAEEQPASTSVTQHGGPIDVSTEPVQSSPVPSVLGVHIAPTNSTVHGSPTNELKESTHPSPTRSNAQEQAASADSEQPGASTDESIDPGQSSLLPSVSGQYAATTNPAIQGSAANGSNESTHHPPTPITVEEHATGTDSKQKGASTDESIDCPQSSSNLQPSRSPTSAESAPREPNKLEHLDAAQIQEAKLATYLEKISKTHQILRLVHS